MNEQNESLPPLTASTIERMETAVFAEIAAEHRPEPARARSRRRRWVTGLGVAAAFAAGILVTPPILGIVESGGVTSTADSFETATDGVQEQNASLPPESTMGTADESRTLATDDVATTREIVATAQASVEVDDVAQAAQDIAALAESRGGYVESTSVGRAGDVLPQAPVDADTGWISIRVPASELSDVIDALADTGEVLSSSVSKQDVTAAAIDLRARVDATRASVQRLTELMAQTASVSELIEAEVALTDRQALLESYEQQLASLEDQVAMSTLQVQLTGKESATADPAGFEDGLAAGWNGLIVSLNALVIAAGFLLPWLAVAAVILLVVLLIRSARRRARATEPKPENDRE